MADYIDRQAAIAALRKFAEDCKGSTEAATAVSVAISVLPRVPSPLVSVEDRLPEKAGVYMTCIAAEDPDVRVVDTAWYDQDRKTWLDAGRYRKVTHWMPLPDVPEVERCQS